MASEKRPSSLYMDLKELRRRFDEVDKTMIGYIDYDGLQQMIAGMDGFDNSMAMELMNSLDRDKDGKVTFEDFQVLFTLERDAVKAEQQKDWQFSQSLSPSSSAYTTAIVSPSSTDTPTFSPEKPPVPPNSRSYKSSVTQVLNSPDLSMHVRSLQGTVFQFPTQDGRHLSQGSEHGDMVLEDTGSIGMTSTDPPITPSPRQNPGFITGFDVIKKELQYICTTGVVERNDILELCSKLDIDTQDKQDYINLWEELQAVGIVTVDDMYQSLKERETAAMVTSTPSTVNKLTMEGWKEGKNFSPPTSLGTPITLSLSEQTDESHISEQKEDNELDEDEDMEEDEEEEVEEDMDKGEWIKGKDFLFKDLPRPVRPSSASKEGMRLSRGHSEISLRQSAAFQSFYNEYNIMQEKMQQISQEQESLKLNLSRVEEEKKKLIHEGEESVQFLQKQKEIAIRKLQVEYNSKTKDMEKSFSEERQTLQERAERRIMALEDQLKAIKAEDEVLREDAKYYQNDNEKLVERLQNLHDEIKLKDERISMLQRACGLPSESVSETDIEMHASRVQELENELQIYAEHNQNLLEQNTELNDKVDEFKTECEMWKQKVVEEQRKRQRIKSSSTKPHSARRRRESGEHSKRSGHLLPYSLATPVTTRKLLEGVEAEGLEIPPKEGTEETDEGLIDIEDTVKVFDDSSEVESVEETEDNDVEDIMAKSSTSLLEELRVTDQKENLLKRISELESQRSILETSCCDLKSQLLTLEDSKVVLRQKLEDELRHKMYQRANLDKHLAQLNKIKEEFTTTRKAVTDKMLTSEDVVARYLHSLETDYNQFVTEDGIGEVTLELYEKVSSLKSQLQASEAIIEEKNKEIQNLRGESIMQKSHIEDLRSDITSLVSTSEALKLEHLELQSQLLTSKNNEKTLDESCKTHYQAIKQLQMKIESQERELKMRKSESGLAIHDLTKKEEECSTLQEKVQTLECELLRLHATKEQHLEDIGELETQLEKARFELKLSTNENTQLQEDLNSSLDEVTKHTEELSEAYKQISSLQDQLSSSKNVVSPTATQEEAFILHSASLLPSPNRSISSSTDQSEILFQMKSQLQQLQKVLVNKGGEEDTDSELSVVKELLAINTTMEESLMNQQQWHDAIIASKEDHIRMLENHLAEADHPVITTSSEKVRISKEYFCKTLSQFSAHSNSSLQSIFNRIQALSYRITALSVALKDVHIMAPNDNDHAVESLLLDLDTSHATVESYQQEVNLLSAGFEESREKLNDSQQKITDLENSKEDEIEILNQELKAVKEELNKSRMEEREKEMVILQQGKELEEKELKNKIQGNIVQRQKKELETLNHYLGKAKSRQQQYNTQKKEREMLLEQQQQCILSTSLEIQQLKQEIERCHSAPELGDENTNTLVDEDLTLPLLSPKNVALLLTQEAKEEIEKIKAAHEAEMLTQKESMQTAEDLITIMRRQLHDLYQCLVDPSDSTASDLLEYSDLIAHIREMFDNLKLEVLHGKQECYNVEQRLKTKSEEYESLYSEHDEEIRAIIQQKESVQSRLNDMEDKFEHLLLNQEQQILRFQSESLKVKEEKAILIETLQETEVEYMKTQKNLSDLEEQKSSLIELIQTLSVRAIYTLSEII